MSTTGRIELKRSWLLIGLLISLATWGELSAPYRGDSLRALIMDGQHSVDDREVAAPLVLDSSTERKLRIVTVGGNYAVGGYAQVRARGPELFVRLSESENPQALGPDRPHCSSVDPSGTWSCRLPFRLQGASWMDIAPTVGVTAIEKFELAVVKTAPMPGTGFESLLKFLGLLSVFALACRVLKIRSSAKALMLAIAGAVWLLASAGVGGLALLIAMAAIYVLIQRQMVAPSLVRRLLVTLASVGLVFVAVKGNVSTWMGRPFVGVAFPVIAIPLGFAFFLIRALDLSFRVATREIKSLSVVEFWTYMLFPATLAAGPIYTLPQFKASVIDHPSMVDWSAGLGRVGVGISKKIIADILLARVIGAQILSLYALPSAMPAGELWLLLTANAAYVYLDFSGYSDIAIGVGRQLGWRVPENFNYPLLRSGMRSFWQSWHITLSTWVARWVHFYTAFSLRRANRLAQATLPVVTCLLLIGLWHEMLWVWLLWGAHHAIGILLGDATSGVIASIPSATLVAPLGRLLRKAGGVVFVWAWLALSQSFTLVSDPRVALETYFAALRLSF